MNDIGLVLTADARAMIKALKDAEGSLKTFSVKTEADLMKMQKAAKETDKALAGMGQGLSASQVNKGLLDLNRNLTATGQTAKQTAAALRGVPAQITDIVVSLQGGQAPMTVFLQQGGQLKDMFGGVVPAAKALTTSLLGMINPVTLAVGAFVALAAAVRAGSQEQQAFRMAIANTGNAAGVTVDQMNGMAEAMGEGFGKTAGKARDALTAMASTGQVARADLQQFAQVAIDVERVTGQSLEKTAENFAALGKDPLGASLRLSETMNYLTVETYKQIKAAQDLGNTQQAAAIAQQAYADAEETRITRAVQGVGYIEWAWRAVSGAAVGAWNAMKETWDWLKSIGRDDPLTKQLAAAEKSAAELQNIVTQYSGTGMGEMRKKELADKLALIESIKEQIRLSKRSGDAEAERVAANTKGIKALIEEEKNASKVKAEAERKAREAEAARKEAAREAAKERQKELDVGILRNKLVEENAKREIKLDQDATKAREDSLRPYLQAMKAAEDRVKSLETEEAALQISESMNVSLAQAVEMVNIAKLKEQQIDAKDDIEVLARLQREIEAREKLVKLIGDKEARDASSKAAKQAATDWQRAADKIQDSITDALMRGFESGKSAAQVLKDTVINMFKTMVLRPVIQGVVGGVMGMGSGSAIAGTGAGGAMSAASGMLGLGGTMAVFGSHLATGFMNTVAGSGFAASMGAASGLAGAGSIAGGAGMAVGALAAPVAIAAVVANALGLMRSSKTVGAGITGMLGGGDLQAYDLNRRGGSLLSGPSYSLRNERPTEQTQALNNAFLAIRTGTAQMAKDLGFATAQIDSFVMAVGDVKVHPDIDRLGLVLDGLTDQQKLAKIEEVLQKSGNAMAELVLGAGATSQQLVQLYASVMQQRAGLEMQLLQAQGNVTEIRKRERDALHESNRSIYDQIKALEDQKIATEKAAQAQTAAAAEAAQAQQLLADAMAATASERKDLEMQLLQAQGNTAKIRELERESIHESNRALYDQIRALEDQRDAAEKAAKAQAEYTQAVESAQAALAAAMSRVQSAQNTVAAVQERGTSAYLAALSEVATIQDQIADQARQTATAYRDLGKQLREYVTGIVTSPGDSFARALNKALSGDREAMSSLPGLAASATDQARNTSSTREQFAAAQARILSGVLEAAAEAQRRGIETPEQAAQTLQQKLLAAQSKLAEALATANAIGAPLVAQQERLIEQYRKALDELVDARAAADRAQATLDAISGNTASTARSLEQWADWVDTEFGKIDTTLDGLLTFDELKVAVAGKATDQQIVSMMNLLDTNNDGLVSKLEAQIGASTSLPEQISLALGGKFDALTKNTAGLLNFDQFKSQFVGLATDTKLLDIFKELDVNGDGQIAKLEAIRIASQTQAQKSNVVAFDRNDPLYSIWSSINTSTAWLKEIHGYLGHIHNTQLGDVTRQNAHQNLLQSISNRIWSTLSVASQNRSGTAAYFATGGAFTNSVVSRPTAFSMGVMGEAGPEAIMPLSNVGGSLGVRANMPGVEGMLDELRALREEVAMLRAEARATAINTGRTQDIMKRITKNGESMIVSTDGEALEVTTP